MQLRFFLSEKLLNNAFKGILISLEEKKSYIPGNIYIPNIIKRHCILSGFLFKLSVFYQ